MLACSEASCAREHNALSNLCSMLRNLRAWLVQSHKGLNPPALSLGPQLVGVFAIQGLQAWRSCPTLQRHELQSCGPWWAREPAPRRRRL